MTHHQRSYIRKIIAQEGEPGNEAVPLDTKLLLSINFFLLAAYSLLVTPQTVPELENDLEVHFFCRENNNTFAVNIAWMDPQEFLYIPGSLNMGNSRITAEGSRLRIVQLLRNDTGMYRCLRSNNPSDFAVGTLLVHGIYHFYK